MQNREERWSLKIKKIDGLGQVMEKYFVIPFISYFMWAHIKSNS